MLEIVKEFPYVYETHMHTKEASACAKATAKEMVDAYKEYGYAGVIITDHAWYGNTAVNRNLPWEQWVKEFCKGYNHAKCQGDKIGLSVFFGYESNYQGTEFLVYGGTEEWMKEHKELKDATLEEQQRLVHEIGGMVIHAHPFREEPYIPNIRLYPNWVDGVEAVNASHSCHRSKAHNNPEFDVLAIAYAKANHLPMTAGSDMHATDLFGGGVAFSHPLESIHDYIKAILSGEEYLLTNGDYYFFKDGTPYSAK